jgi:hypothetical protein
VAELRFSDFSRSADTVGLNVAGEAARVELSEPLARAEPSEFVCVMTAHVVCAAPWFATAMRLRAGVDGCNAPLQLDGNAVKPILAGGVVTHPDDGDDTRTVIDRSIAAEA